jgi:hypothetical protein
MQQKMKKTIEWRENKEKEMPIHAWRKAAGVKGSQVRAAE